MTLNIITNQTGYVTFQIYDKVTGLLSTTFDIPKINVTSIQSYPNEKNGTQIGFVIITTISQNPQYFKSNGILELIPTDWALSTSSTTPIADVTDLRTDLLGYFSTKW